MNTKRHLRILAALILALCLTLGAPLMALGTENDMIQEVRDLLKNQYVDVVSDDVLNAPTIPEILKRLGDRNTEYMTAAEYDQFLDTLNMSFSGVGIEMEKVSQGVKVTKVMEGYGADKAGVRTGDILIEADGYSLAGKTTEYCAGKLRGLAGTTVKVKVLRGTQTLSYTITRMTIELPLVEGALLEEHIGYIAVYSFGEDTTTQFDRIARALNEKGADCWVIDLRNNGGGYTQAAIELLGYFIGEKTAVITKSRDIGIVYKAIKQDVTLQGPIVLLTNKYTASSSEIVSAALKDHEKATLVGETTYGSGRVKALMPLSNGDYLKMSIYRFFSPNSMAIDFVGVKPHLDLTGVDELKTAVLMLKNFDPDTNTTSTDKTNYLLLEAGPYSYPLSLEDIRNSKNWLIGKKILDSAYVTTTLKLGGLNGWEPFYEEYLTDRYQIYYPGYVKAGDLRNIPVNKVFTVTYTRPMDWESVTQDSIELIDTTTGDRIASTFTSLDDFRMTVTPVAALKANTPYWLVIHSTIKDREGNTSTGGVALAMTAK